MAFIFKRHESSGINSLDPAHVLQHLRSEYNHIENQIEHINIDQQSQNKRSEFFDTDLTTQNAVKAIAAIKDRTNSTLQNLKQQKTDAQTVCRNFQAEYQIKRPPRKPDLFKTFFIISLFFVIEGLLTSGLFIADGHFDIIPALAIGFCVAGINIIAATVMGYFPLRYITYRLGSSAYILRDAIIRIIAYLGLAVTLLGLSALHFGAMRVRVTGKHSNIFNFSEINLVQSFNDYFSIALLVLGVIGAIIAAYKGRNHISDPIVGYAELSLDAQHQINLSLDDVFDEAISSIDERYEDARDIIEDECDDRNDLSSENKKALITLNKSIRVHNNNVSGAIERLNANFVAEQKRNQFVNQKNIDAQTLNIDAFEALRHGQIKIKLNAFSPPTECLNALSAAYQDSLNGIRTAYGDAVNFTPKFTI